MAEDPRPNTDHGRLGADLAAVEARLGESLRQIQVPRHQVPVSTDRSPTLRARAHARPRPATQGELASVHDGHASLNGDGPGPPAL